MCTILIISTCSDKLSELEFVKPVEDILRRSRTKFLTRNYLNVTQKDLKKARKIIICGTALKDFGYLESVDRFDWLKEFGRPVLGICAGMQILGKIFNNDLIKKIKIGQYNVIAKKNKLTPREFKSYFLNSKAVDTKGFEPLARTGRLCCMFKHRRKELYGCLFHPEVLNPEIIMNFAANI